MLSHTAHNWIVYYISITGQAIFDFELSIEKCLLVCWDVAPEIRGAFGHKRQKLRNLKQATTWSQTLPNAGREKKNGRRQRKRTRNNIFFFSLRARNTFIYLLCAFGIGLLNLDENTTVPFHSMHSWQLLSGYFFCCFVSRLCCVQGRAKRTHNETDKHAHRTHRANTDIYLFN